MLGLDAVAESVCNASIPCQGAGLSFSCSATSPAPCCCTWKSSGGWPTYLGTCHHVGDRNGVAQPWPLWSSFSFFPFDWHPASQIHNLNPKKKKKNQSGKVILSTYKLNKKDLRNKFKNMYVFVKVRIYIPSQFKWILRMLRIWRFVRKGCRKYLVFPSVFS